MRLESTDQQTVAVGEVDLAVRVVGSGPPLLLLHGYPQTHRMWHAIVPALAESRTLVLPDLRGYGASAKPAGGATAYTKRAMAADVAGLMTELGFDRFDVAGHDRGARVTHRLCLDHPDRVGRAAVLDVIPSRHAFATTDKALASAYYHWFFLAQPAGHPEKLIAADPGYWVRYHLDSWSDVAGAFDPAAVADYVAAFADPDAIRATCDDYRAGAGPDGEDDDASFAAGDRVTAPLLVMWGSRGFVGSNYDVAAVWRDYAAEVSTGVLDCGHFLAEERPSETATALLDFFG